MKNTLIRLVGAALLALAVSTAAKANTINGVIQFTNGSAVLNSDDPATANSVTSITGTKVLSASGDFGSFLSGGEDVTFVTPWNFGGSTINNFWSVDGFSFDLTESHIVSTGYTDPISGEFVPWLQVSGVGFVSGHGFTDTIGYFTFATQGSAVNGSFGFYSDAAFRGQGVPDGGTTALLVGFGLVGLSFIARRRK